MRHLSLPLFVLLIACGSSKPAPVGPGSAAKPAAKPRPIAPTDVVTYYVGTAEAMMGEKSLAKEQIAVQRVVSRESGIITETVAETGDKPAEFIVTMKVDGSKFTMTEATSAFTGTGELVGEPWNWTEWTSTSALADGATVKSTDRLTGTGMAVEKIYNGNGMTFTIIEDLKAADKATYEAKRQEILSQKPRPPR